MRPLLVMLLLLLTTLTGCSEADAPDDPMVTDPLLDDIILEEGKGAIAGLLVDDRFRPIELTDEPQSEFQASGFVLLQETGDQVQTTANGEFSFIDLEPGTYTLRVTASGHEAVPQKVVVEEGLFAEASVVARRVVSAGGLIITQEYSGFIACAVQVVVETIIGDCTLDQSGDSTRIRFDSNLTALNVTTLVTEMRANQVGDYGLQIGWGEADASLNYGYYGAVDAYDTDYMRMDLVYNETSESTICFFGLCTPLDPFLNDRDFHTTVFLYGEGSEELRGVAPGTYPFTGAGVDLGVKLRFLQSAFIGEPEIDVAAYCILC